MTTRMQDLLRLLTAVAENVQASADQAVQAERRSERLAELLDAMSAQNEALQQNLDRAEEAARDAAARHETALRGLREQVEAARRLNAVLEARASQAEARIGRAAEALGLVGPDELPVRLDEGALRPGTALH